ncbi:MAG: MFS transporter [Chloroflexi bacterium]|nr:MAG: MFS transporter [Chloroflexota bacterium]
MGRSALRLASPVGQRLWATSSRPTPPPRAGPKAEPAGTAPRVTRRLYGPQARVGHSSHACEGAGTLARVRDRDVATPAPPDEAPPVPPSPATTPGDAQGEWVAKLRQELDTRYRARALGALLTATGLLRVAAVGTGVALQFYLSDLAGGRPSGITIGLVGASQAAAEMVFSPFLARNADRLGRTRFLVGGPLIGALGVLLAAAAVGASQVAGARVLEGIGAAAFVPTALGTIAAGTAQSRVVRAQASGAFEGSTLAGYAGGFALGPFAYFALHRFAFVVLALLYVAAALVCLWFLPRVPRQQVSPLRTVFRAALGPGPLRAFLPAWLCVFALIGSFVAHMPALLRHSRVSGQTLMHHFDERFIGVLLVLGIGMFLIGIVGGLRARRGHVPGRLLRIARRRPVGTDVLLHRDARRRWSHRGHPRRSRDPIVPRGWPAVVWIRAVADHVHADPRAGARRRRVGASDAATLRRHHAQASRAGPGREGRRQAVSVPTPRERGAAVDVMHLVDVDVVSLQPAHRQPERPRCVYSIGRPLRDRPQRAHHDVAGKAAALQGRCDAPPSLLIQVTAARLALQQVARSVDRRLLLVLRNRRHRVARGISADAAGSQIGEHPRPPMPGATVAAHHGGRQGCVIDVPERAAALHRG